MEAAEPDLGTSYDYETVESEIIGALAALGLESQEEESAESETYQLCEGMNQEPNDSSSDSTPLVLSSGSNGNGVAQASEESDTDSSTDSDEPGPALAEDGATTMSGAKVFGEPAPPEVQGVELVRPCSRLVGLDVVKDGEKTWTVTAIFMQQAAQGQGDGQVHKLAPQCKASLLARIIAAKCGLMPNTAYLLWVKVTPTRTILMPVSPSRRALDTNQCVDRLMLVAQAVDEHPGLSASSRA